MKKDFLALSQFSKAELDAIFALTKELKQKQKTGVEHHLLKGKTLAMIWQGWCRSVRPLMIGTEAYLANSSTVFWAKVRIMTPSQ